MLGTILIVVLLLLLVGRLAVLAAQPQLGLLPVRNAWAWCW